MSDTAETEVLEFGTIVVIGGGCYGSQYVRQLRRARAAGRVRFDRVLSVDRDGDCALARSIAADPEGSVDLHGEADRWSGVEVVTSDWATFLASWLDAAVADPQSRARDAIVPSPLMPHLLFEWLHVRARAQAGGRELPVITPPEIAGVPWQKAGGDGTRYVSYATWMCPINCIEPSKCPHTKGPRDWSLHETLVEQGAGDAVALLRVTHRTFGVGMIDVADVVRAHATMRGAVAAGTPLRVATASHCHGAVATIGLS
jgi:hypothetical protein